MDIKALQTYYQHMKHWPSPPPPPKRDSVRAIWGVRVVALGNMLGYPLNDQTDNFVKQNKMWWTKQNR